MQLSRTNKQKLKGGGKREKSPNVTSQEKKKKLGICIQYCTGRVLQSKLLCFVAKLGLHLHLRKGEFLDVLIPF